MILLIVITDYGSFNNFLTELVLKIAATPGFEVHIICSEAKVINIPDKHNFEHKLNFHFVNIPRKVSLIQEIVIARKIHQVVKLISPNLVHIHFTTAAFPTLLFKNTTIKYWATFHGLGMNSSTGLKKVIFTLVELWCFKRLNRIYAVNSEDFKLIKKLFPAKAKKYECLGFGCDINKYNINISVKEEMLKLYNIESNHVVIAYTGRFVSFKGFNLVIKAFKSLTLKYPEKFKLILMGGRDPIHPTGLDEIDDNFLKNSKDIINIGFTSEVEKYLSISDIFLFPSKKEGLPTCTLEALSMGVPAISFNTRGNNDLVKHNYNGLLLNTDGSVVNQVERIVDSIINLSSDKELFLKLKENALNDRHLYSRERFVVEHMEYYKSFNNNV